MGDVAYAIKYEVKIDYEPVDGETFDNISKLKNDDQDEIIAENEYRYSLGEGIAEGYVFKINIHKTDENGRALQGVKFDVIRKRNNTDLGTITTDSNGSGKVENLLRDEYKLVEV